MQIIIDMYITMLPIILSGIFNMVFTKTKFYKNHNYPIDGYKSWKDGKRIFGNNKTYIGFVSMIVFSMVFQVFIGYIYLITNLQNHSDLYISNENILLFNIVIGFLFGFSYMILELPNSFIKRRLNIESGKTKSGKIGFCFFLVDQIDSLLGVMLVLYMFSNISFLKYINYVILGGITHITINYILYLLKIRKNF